MPSVTVSPKAGLITIGVTHGCRHLVFANGISQWTEVSLLNIRDPEVLIILNYIMEQDKHRGEVHLRG